jgi:AcrR family transcriptional regulator
VATQAERRKQTRRKLLEAGTSVLLQQGAAGFSTVAVADAAELSNGAVFNHFSTRLDLLTATVEFALAELREGFAQEFSVVGADASATELLSILWQCMDRPEQVAVTEVFALARTNPELQEALTPIVQDHHRHIKNMLALLADAQVGAADNRSTDSGGTRPAHGITAEFVESVSFLFIYAMVGLTINNAAGAGIGAEDDFLRLGQHIFNAVELQGGEEG